jgi:hypothetical protein
VELCGTSSNSLEFPFLLKRMEDLWNSMEFTRKGMEDLWNSMEFTKKGMEPS